jgi:hypothetical protein
MKSKHISLSSSTNASVVLTSTTQVDNYFDNKGTAQTRNRTPRFGYVDVINVDGGGIVYVRVDGTNPTVGGDNSYVVPALKDAKVTIPLDETSVTVRLIASASSNVGVVAY